MKIAIMIIVAAIIYGMGFSGGLAWGEHHAFDDTKHLICPRNPGGTTLDVHKQPPAPLTLERLYRHRNPHRNPLIPDGTEIIQVSHELPE